MLKKPLRSLAAYCLGLYFTCFLLPSALKISDSALGFLAAAAAIKISALLFKPVTNLLLLPVHLLTFGVFRRIYFVAAVFVADRLLPQITVAPFVFDSVSLNQISLPPISFSYTGSLLLVSFFLALLVGFFSWLFRD